MKEKNNLSINKTAVFQILAVFVLSISHSSCKKAVEVTASPTSLVNSTVFTSNTTAIAAVTGMFQQLAGPSDLVGNGGYGGSTNFTSIAGLSADEFQLAPNVTNVLPLAYTNALTAQYTPIPFWSSMYQCIYNANAAIEGLTKSNSVTTPVKNQLIGESKFMRAFCFFYLVNTFGDVPLAITTNYQVNNSLARAPKAQVYQQIITDLTDAQNLLSSGYVTLAGASTSEKTLPNQGAATALLARVYLYYGNLTGDQSNFTKAEAQSTSVINNYGYSLLTDLNSVFLKNSMEAIWQLPSVTTGYNTGDGYTFILTTVPANGTSPMYLSSQILTSFEPGDNRKVNWIGNYVDPSSHTSYYFAYKYKVKGGPAGTPVSEYYMVLRLAEQYLIRAEVRAQLGEGTAVDDLNAIRRRAGLGNYSGATDKQSILAAILHERQIELFAEWGHRWLDLKRTGNVDAVMSIVTPLKGGGAWNTNKQLFPIQLSDIKIDPNLTQNQGY